MASDIVLRCRDCGRDFTFTAGEQEFYASRGLTNYPSRCPECRAQRKASRGVSDGRPSGGARQMYDAICASCGRPTQVPFEPRSDRPVYCSDCYEQRNPRRSSSHSSRY